MFVLGVSVSGYATHLRAGEITVERVSCNSLTFRITVTVFTNTINTSVLFGGEDDWLDFGDGSRPRLVPETPNTLRPDLGEGIATASYTIEYTYSGYGEYVISYSEPNRNEGVVNMDISVNTRFYIETKIVVDPFFGCNNTPKLLVPPIDRACTGATWFHNPGAYDPDGDSISYELVIPFRAEDQTVVNYKDPSDPKYYTNYEVGNEAATGRPTFSINPQDGTLTWDAPGNLGVGEYNIAFIIKEWRQIDGEWVSNGFVRRDMQIIVEDCENERPDLIVPEDVCVEAGTTLDETIFGIDPDNDPVKIEAFSEIFQFAPAKSPATWKPNDGVFRPSNPPYELKFQWQTTCEHVKEQPYQVVFKVTDNSKEGVNLVTFKTWNIRVVGPPPQWAEATVDLQTRVSTVKWDPYFCQNAETMQVWRRVDSFAFEPDSCQTGMPEFLGYEMIGSVNVKTTNQFVDNNNGAGLASGAQYCYRLVALFPKPKGGESYVSEEICLDPILADEPVITNVSIENTSASTGRVLVRWTHPFDINKTQFPEPYEYEVYRAEGFAGNAGLTKAHPGRLSDTVFIDQGLNTRDIIYNYRIILWSKSSTNPAYAKIDTSSTASTVRLSASSEVGQIQLNWSAFVPWSNIVLTTPNKHLLYRGPGPAATAESQLELIAEIDPTTGGLTYLDKGQHNNVPLSDTQEYCYRVMTRGAYGNPFLKEPLENFSQMVCAIPNDTIPPACKIALEIELTNCEEFFATQPCDISSFRNVLSWVRPDEDCAEDIEGYKIYRSSSVDGVYVWLDNVGIDGIVRDTFFIDDGENHIGLPSLAFCYKISAVDRSGNESELSDPSCNDNCPYYELPNVFSPNSGDECNDRFSAWRMPNSYIKSIDENGVIDWGPCGPVDVTKCARFVESVVFSVYNRWGKEVYSYESGSERSIYIDWDGRDNEGRELAAGIYYYAAEVKFDSVDPAKANQTIKGWVHLLR